MKGRPRDLRRKEGNSGQEGGSDGREEKDMKVWVTAELDRYR